MFISCLERIPDQIGYLVISEEVHHLTLMFEDYVYAVTISGQKVFVVKRQNNQREPVIV
uniref:Ragulator complex protein LAMTOR4 n=1 Tax=Sinocyclocheilus rhinocerous TaxID=307959 RepID=A0A673HTS3_9TELE